MAHWNADAPARRFTEVSRDYEPTDLGADEQQAVDLRDESRINMRGRSRPPGPVPNLDSGVEDVTAEQNLTPFEPTWVAAEDHPETPADPGIEGEATEGVEAQADLPAYVEAELDETFTPADPPPLSKAIPWRAGVAWLLIIGPPVAMIILGFVDAELSNFRVGLAALAFIAGCLMLVLQLQSRDDDPPENDGAVV